MTVATYLMRGVCLLIVGGGVVVGALYVAVEVERAQQRRNRRRLDRHNPATCPVCRGRARHARSGAERISQW